MRITDQEGAYPLDTGESASSATWLRRISTPLIIAIGTIALFFASYPHLIKEARSQGFVLKEFAPLMNLLIGWGERLYWLGGRPLFLPTVLALVTASLIIIFSLLKKDITALLSQREVLVFSAAFLLMYLIGGTRSFPLYVAGVVLIPALGWLGERGVTEALPEPAPISGKEKAVLAVLLLSGFVVRIYAVDVFPRLYTADEQLLAQVALELGERPLQFFSQPNIMKPHLLRIGAIRAAFSLFGVGLFQQRTVSVLEGTATILLVYLLAKELWGNRAGMFSAFLLAFDPWHIGHSKFGVHNIEGPFFLALLLLLAVRMVRRGGIRNALFLGFAAGATTYLYLSCLIMAPFMIISSLLGRWRAFRKANGQIGKEAFAMCAAAVMMALPYFTLGRANIGKLEDFYKAGGNVLTLAQDQGWNPLFALFVNFWSGIEFLVDWTSRVGHPAKLFYPDPIIIALALVGLGVLAAMRKNFGRLLILLWMPVAFVPVSLSYGFAERRLFAVFAPVPAMLGGLALAKLWESGRLQRGFRRLGKPLAISILVPVFLVSMFIVYRDADPLSGGRPHPRKAAEFIGSLPPEYSVLISSSVKDVPFLVYLMNYDRLNGAREGGAVSFLSFEVLAAMKERIAATPQLAVVTDNGPSERNLMRELKRLNPRIELVESEDFLACLVH